MDRKTKRCFVLLLWGVLSIGSNLSAESRKEKTSAGSPPNAVQKIIKPDRQEAVVESRIQLIGKSNFEKVDSLRQQTETFRITRPTGFVYTSEGQSCSGFLISRDLFLTSYHCLYRKKNNYIDLQNIQIFMDYLGVELPESQGLQVKEIIVGKKRYDFTLLRLADFPGDTFGWYQIERKPLKKVKSVWLVQHPLGRSKEIVRDQTTVIKLTRTRIRYLADTDLGSSGAPVLIPHSNRVVAIHQQGRKDYNEGVLLKVIYPYIQRWVEE